MLFKQYSKITFRFTIEVKEFSIKAWAGLQGTINLRFPQFLDSQHMKMVRLSAHISAAFTLQEIPLGHSAVGRIKSMTNADDP
jgi:hypothetical protein